MNEVDMFQLSSSRLTSAQCQALRMVLSITDDSCPKWDHDMDLKMPEHTSYHFSR